MSWVAVGVAGFQIISGMQQAETVRKNAELTKKMNDFNAGLIEIDAHNAELQGYSEEARYQTVIDQTISSQKVGMAAQDVDINFGTAKDIQEETKLTGELNKMDILNQAYDKAAGLKHQARQVRLQGFFNQTASDAQADAIQNTALINAASTGLSGYKSFKKK